jgi:NADP-dependent alcohol dehydrogenase
MLNFEYQNPTKVLFGKGQIAKISHEIPSDARILIIYGGGSIIANGTLEQAKRALSGRNITEFGGIEPNPDYETLMKAVDVIAQKRINFLLAIGGGSVIDGTKFIAAAACWELGDPWEILHNKGKGIRNIIPFGCILTLPATGSEMNQHAVISRKTRQVSLPSASGSQGNSGAMAMHSQIAKEKLAFSNDKVYPHFAVLDPLTTLSLPKAQIANGIVDAFSHVIEQYLTYPVNANLQDRFAESIMLTLLDDGIKSYQNPNDYDSRANLMWCATMALNGLIGAGVPQDWSSHAIGHELTALFDLAHAETLAIVLPASMLIRKQEKRAKLLQYAKRVWNIDGQDEDVVIQQAIDKTVNFFESLGFATRLSAYHIKEEQLPTIAATLLKHGMNGIGEHGSVTVEVCEEILHHAL